MVKEWAVFPGFLLVAAAHIKFVGVVGVNSLVVVQGTHVQIPQARKNGEQDYDYIEGYFQIQPEIAALVRPASNGTPPGTARPKTFFGLFCQFFRRSRKRLW